MASLGGIDLSQLLTGVQQGLGDLMGGFRPETQNPALAGNGERTGPDLFAGLSYGGQATAYTPPSGDPFAGYRAPGGGDLFDGLYGGGEDLFSGLSYGSSDLFGGFQEAKARVDRGKADQAAQAQAAAAIAGIQGGAGGNWSGPATADDNKTLTAQQIDAWIAQTRPNAPIAGMGAYILQAANQRGVSVPQMLGIFLKESELGTTAGPNKILSGITDPSRDGGLGGQRAFEGFASWAAAIDATADLLATSIYKGKSLAEQIGAWYVGPQEYAANGVNATDKAGNGTVGDYLNLVSQVYQALGVGFNPQQAPTRAAGVPGVSGGPWLEAGKALLGTPYQLGGRRANGRVGPGIGIDCSEFTAYLLEQEGKQVTWNAQAQFNETQRVDRSQLASGDLVFFQGTYDTGRGEYVTHVGRFVGYDAQGNPIMIHAGNGGVQYANLNDSYWQQHWAGAGRLA